ncbi:MAG: antitoxin component YwqK of YwqJK toxin-antitoxin module [Verrucomicrobiales bacterium]|jgi:antitoxin component YwqK of YwqJK toxin-antitoxin module
MMVRKGPPFDSEYRREGISTYWDADGKVISSGQYKDGVAEPK